MTEQAMSDGVPARLVSVAELAAYLNVSPGWVRKGILDRTLPFTRLGKNIRFTPDQVAQIVTGGEHPPIGDPRHRFRRTSTRTRL